MVCVREKTSHFVFELLNKDKGCPNLLSTLRRYSYSYLFISYIYSRKGVICTVRTNKQTNRFWFSKARALISSQVSLLLTYEDLMCGVAV